MNENICCFEDCTRILVDDRKVGVSGKVSAEPVMEGFCCATCYVMIVIPRTLNFNFLEEEE